MFSCRKQSNFTFRSGYFVYSITLLFHLHMSIIQEYRMPTIHAVTYFLYIINSSYVRSFHTILAVTTRDAIWSLDYVYIIDYVLSVGYTACKI